MKTALFTVNFQLIPHVRRETQAGTEYVVAPVVAVRAGVLNGQLLPAEEIAKSVAAWDGVPLPIGHPFENGVHISVNREDLLAACVGTFRNPTFDGFALRGELWLNTTRAQSLGGDALTVIERIERGEMLEVSTAYDVRSPAPNQGVFNGQQYDGIQRNIHPDHLALLPHTVGACSVQDGCGAPRVNQQKESAVKEKTSKGFLASVKERLFGQMQANIEQSFSDIRRALYTALEEAEIERDKGMSGWVDIEDSYDALVVYRVSLNGIFSEQLYSRSYTLDDNGKATLGDRSEVVKETRYLPVTANSDDSKTQAHTKNCDCPDTEQHVTNTQEVQMDKKELVSNVLKARGLGEEAREGLMTLPEATLQKLAVNADQATQQPAQQQQQQQPAPVQVPVDLAAQITAAVAAALPQVNPDVLHMQQMQVNQAAQHRAQLTTHVVTNSTFTQEQCQAMQLGMLEQLASNLTVSTGNYGGRIMPHLSTNEDDNTVPDAPSYLLGDPEKAQATEQSH